MCIDLGHSNFQLVHAEACALWGSVFIILCGAFVSTHNAATDDHTYQSDLPKDWYIDSSIEVSTM